MSEPPPDEAPASPPVPRSSADALLENADPERVQSMAVTFQEDMRQDIDLRRMYAKAALLGMASQVVLADVVFIIYAVGRRWDIPDPVMSAWLAATVVQVVAVTLAVTRGLFPPQRR